MNIIVVDKQIFELSFKLFTHVLIFFIFIQQLYYLYILLYFETESKIITIFLLATIFKLSTENLFKETIYFSYVSTRIF